MMLDNPKKTEPLLVALKAAVPFEVELMPALIERLRAENIAALNEIRQTVSDVSYAGDEGGIVCHIVPSDRREALILSLTHVRIPRTMPLATAIIDYQKHRVKKLKSRGTTEFVERFLRITVADWRIWSQERHHVWPMSAVPPRATESGTAVI